MTGKPFDRYRETYDDCLPDDRDAPVLGVGCGPGQFPRFLEMEGYRRAEGLDLSPQGA